MTMLIKGGTKSNLAAKIYYKKEFCYSVWNQCESFICPNLMVKNRDTY
jgi:hypothetical protein